MNAQNPEVGQGQYVSLPPESIKVSEAQNVRPFSSANPNGDAEILKELARSIRDHGQKQPVLVRVVNDEYQLIAGHRRHRAIQLLNSGKIDGKAPKQGYLVNAVIVSEDDPKAYQSAIVENVHRQNMSPIDLALVIKNLREQNGWTGDKGTKPLAKYLNVSVATVTQHDKLATLLDDPDNVELVEKIHSREIGAVAALELLNVKPEKRKEVAASAIATANKRAEEKKAAGKPGKKAGKVTAADVRKAAKAKNSQIEVKSLSRKELLEVFEVDFSGKTAWPTVMAEFARYFYAEYATGKSGEQGLINRWRAIASELEGGDTPKTEKSKSKK